MLLKNYVSEIDRFLAELDTQAGSHSASRAEEEAKHKGIAEARDNPAIKDAVGAGLSAGPDSTVVNTPS